MLYGARGIVVEVDRLGGTGVNAGLRGQKVTWYVANISNAIRESHNFGFNTKHEGILFHWTSFVRKSAAYVEDLPPIYRDKLRNDRVE
jgi:pyruvate/2-oxoglutarate dehydrogenase complex dihydrolipoamide dehydrogenase (E3) component